MRYLLWQFRHLHTIHFDINEQGQTYCPYCQSIYQKRNTVSTNRDDVTPPYTPKAPKSPLVLLTFGFLIMGAVTLVAAAFLSFPFVAAAGIFNGLTAIALAVLSLREDK